MAITLIFWRDFALHPWRFGTVPRGYWDLKENHVIFLDWLGKQLGYEILDDWYKIDKKLIIKNGGGGILQRYNNSPFHMIQSIYPKHKLVEMEVQNNVWKLLERKGKSETIYGLVR